MKSIIYWGVRDRRGTIFGWSLGIGIYIAINILVYSSIGDQAQALNKVLDGLPAGARALFSDSSDLLSPIGYLSSKLYYLILPMLFTVLAITLSSQLLSREEQDGTLELLLARPISRAKLLLAKITAGLIVVGAVGLISLVVTIICMKSIDYQVAVDKVVLATGMTLLLSLLFGSIAWAMVGIGRFGHRASVGVASFIALGSYLFSSLEGIATWLEWPAKLLPFHYYQPTAILNGTYNWWNAVGMLIATLVLLSIAFIGFRRRDLN